MMRRALILPLLCLALNAQAQDIVLSNDSKTIADAANKPAEAALAPENRSLLVRLVSYGCARKARQTPEFIALSKRSKKDSAGIYCGCMAPAIMDRLTTQNVEVMMQTHAPDPALQQALVPVAQTCMKQAGQK